MLLLFPVIDISRAQHPAPQHSVRVADLGQGSNALRVTALRSLPDVDVVDVLQGADDKVKEHLKREHVVRRHFTIVSFRMIVLS